MIGPTQESFPPGVAEKLQHYVYRLIDPRNGETFYVGKGKGDRVFSHVRCELDQEDLNDKLTRIRTIQIAGFQVAHVIHRHGMDEKTALEVEAPGLTNIVGGNGSGDFGAMHAKQIIDRYCAEPVEFHHRALLISVGRTACDMLLYEAIRYAWKINKIKAAQAEIVLAVRQGIIVGAYIAQKWVDATPENFPGREGAPGRMGFIGRPASAEMAKQYVGKRLPDEYRKRGAANPIKYSW